MTEASRLAPQREIPLALIHGEKVTQLPEGLYIPPDALEVFLEEFEGPLDLLLYLIRRQNLDIQNLPVAEITEQYLRYIALMKEIKLELAAEYLVMAALLAEIKSRSLLPLPPGEEEEDDPREELIRRLQDYEQFKNAAQSLDELPRLERDVHAVSLDTRDLSVPRPLPHVETTDLLMALQAMELRIQFNASHQIETERLSVRERISQIMRTIGLAQEDCSFHTFFAPSEGRMGVAVTLLAVLELLALNLIVCRQETSYGPIHIRIQQAALDPTASDHA